MARVLVADDDDLVRRMFASLLTRSGFEVTTAADGREALAMARHRRPDLIVSDVLMPVMDGFAFCREVKSDPSLEHIPFVFCTASFTDNEDEALARQLGADEYITKPPEPDEFVNTVRRLLESRAVDADSRESEPSNDEGSFLRSYSAALSRKLSEKVAALEKANLALEEANQALAHDVEERRRAEQEARRQLQELRVIHTIATVGASAQSADVLLGRAEALISETLRADMARIWLRQAASGTLARTTQRAVRLDDPNETPALADVVRQVFAFGVPVRIDDETGEPGNGSGRARLAVVSQLAVPLRRVDETIGVIHAVSRRQNAFRSADVQFLAVCADQLATAIGRLELTKLLEQRVHDRSRELAALYDVTAMANERVELEPMLDQLLKRVIEALEGESGAIHLLDQRETRLLLCAQLGLPDELAATMESLPLDDSLPGWVVRNAQPLALRDMGSDQRTSAMFRSHFAERAMLAAPVRVRGQVLGAISVIGRVGQSLNLESIALLSSIADHVGVVVENALLRRHLEDTAALHERQRLARELHDSVVQSLYAVTLLAEGGRRLLGTGDLNRENIDQYMTDLKETAHQALKETRLLVYELRPPILEQEGLAGALQHRLDAVEKRAGVQADMVVEGTLDLPSDLEAELYRVAQEALNNALKHAAASSVTIRLCAADGRITLQISDDGIGFDVAAENASHASAGMGLVSIRERVQALGGDLMVTSDLGRGTSIMVRLVIAPSEKPMEWRQRISSAILSMERNR